MRFLNWVYPPRCVVCGALRPAQERCREEDWLCETCAKEFLPIIPPVCLRCGIPCETKKSVCASCRDKTLYFDQNCAIYTYEELVRDMILAVKFRGKRSIAAVLGKLAADSLPADKQLDFAAYDYFVPVPMYRRKERRRGFNQADVMGKVIAYRLEAPYAADLLIRIRSTQRQSGLLPPEREENVKNAFVVNPRYTVDDKRICLVDDIYTTGATLNACAQVLKKAGAAQISCITLSIAVKNMEKV